MLEIKTINKNKKQRSYQAIKTPGVFEAINEVKEQETKFLLSLRRFPFFNFIALNQAKEQGTNSYQGTKTCRFGF